MGIEEVTIKMFQTSNGFKSPSKEEAEKEEIKYQIYKNTSIHIKTAEEIAFYGTTILTILKRVYEG